MHYRPSSRRAMAAFFLCILSTIPVLAIESAIAAAVVGCVAPVESGENVGEALGPLACGVRGTCPVGQACDWSDLTCRPVCNAASGCDDGNPCTVDTCGHGLCYYSLDVTCHPSCRSWMDCPGVECAFPTCNNGYCAYSYAPEGFTCSDGDGRCDGAGNCH